MPAVPIERVRQAVIRAVSESSLRKLAREIGLSAPGLTHFIEGGEPFKPTVRKLVEWYVRDAANRRGIDQDTATAALSLLTDGMPNAEAEATRARILAELRDGYKRSGTPPPAWLEP